MIIIIPGNSNMGVALGSVGSEATIIFLPFFRKKKKKGDKLMGTELDLTFGCASFKPQC